MGIFFDKISNIWKLGDDDVEISTVKMPELTVTNPMANNNTNSPFNQQISSVNSTSKIESENYDKSSEQDKLNDKNKKQLSKDDILEINGALNSFMTAINSDLHFVVHEKTKEIMLQVIDRRDNKVIKEIPSHEMLDVIANIRESVGALFDKHI